MADSERHSLKKEIQKNSAINRTAEILKINMRRFFIPHLLTAVLVALLTAVIFGLSNIKGAAAAAPFEYTLIFCGPVLLISVFIPEQKRESIELLAIKPVVPAFVCMLRTAYSMAALFVIIAAYGFLMRCRGSAVTPEIIAGGCFGAVFLGGIGMIAFVLSDSLTTAYMIPVVVYGLSFAGGEKLGVFYLFSMQAKDFMPKLWLLLFGCLLTAAALLIKKIRP